MTFLHTLHGALQQMCAEVCLCIYVKEISHHDLYQTCLQIIKDFLQSVKSKLRYPIYAQNVLHLHF